MDKVWQDLRYAVRMLAKNPGYTALALLSMAIGIGVNSTAFSIIDCIFLRSMPVKDPKQLVWIYSSKQGHYQSFSYPAYQDLSRESKSFEGIAAVSRHGAQLNLNGELEIIRTDWVSDNFFSVMGIKPAIGQWFVTADKRNPGEDPPVVVSYGLWKRRFGSDPAIIGKTIVLNQRNFIIRAVAPPSFVGLLALVPTETWILFDAWMDPKNLQRRDSHFTSELLGRLQPGTPIGQAQAELETIAHRLALAYPASEGGISYRLERTRRENLLIMAAVFLSGPLLILIICCANVSGMALAQAESRRNEIAVRLAMGSGRFRVLQQMFTESLVIALLGGALGLVLTLWLIGLQPSLMPPMPMYLHIDFRVDARVLLFTLVVSIAATLLSGLAPAFHATKAEVAESLKGSVGGSEGGRHGFRLRNALVVGQVALSLTLLIATGLFLKSLQLTQQIETGFDTRKNLLIVSVGLPSLRPQETSQRFFLPLIEQIKTVPGVKGATYAFRMLMSGSGEGASCEVSIPGIENPAGQKGHVIRFNLVGRDYFRTLGTAIRGGRAFDRYDELPNQRNVIINETMAKRFWPGMDPVGRHLVTAGTDYQVVGVAQDSKINSIHEAAEPYIYFPFVQVPYSSEGTIIVETIGNPRPLAGALKNRIFATDRTAIVQPARTLDEFMAYVYYQDRILALCSGSVGLIGIILAAIGLYGTVAYLARRRTHEIGVRIALGAKHGDISSLVIGKGFKVSLLGVAVGLIISFFAMRLISSGLYGVAPTDIWIFSSASIIVLVIAILASYIPARRAAKVDPVVALRYE